MLPASLWLGDGKGMDNWSLYRRFVYRFTNQAITVAKNQWFIDPSVMSAPASN